MPMVSIVTPVFNARKWLEETAHSVLSQSYKNIEWVVVNDGSSDDSLAYLESLNDNRVRVFSSERRGACSARNQGWREARGQYIKWIDADDLMSLNAIEVQMARITEAGDDYLVNGAWGRFTDSPQNTVYQPTPLWADMSPMDFLVCTWEDGGMMASHAWLLPINLAKRAGPWNESLRKNQDGEFFCRALLVSQGAVFCPEARFLYRSGRADSVSQYHDRDIETTWLHSLELCESRMRVVEDSPRVRQACANAYLRYAVKVYPVYKTLAAHADARVKALGGASRFLEKGRAFALLSRLAGWRFARLIQYWQQRMCCQ